MASTVVLQSTVPIAPLQGGIMATVWDSRVKGWVTVLQAPSTTTPVKGTSGKRLSTGNPLSWDLGRLRETNLSDPPGVKANAQRAFTRCFRDKVETPKTPAVLTEL